eukprot:7408402-Karenia_brevis.AAC.1
MDNPHQFGTKIHGEFESVPGANTIGQAKKGGAILWELRGWLEKGCISIGRGATMEAARSKEEEEKEMTEKDGMVGGKGEGMEEFTRSMDGNDMGSSKLSREMFHGDGEICDRNVSEWRRKSRNVANISK